MVLLTKKTTKRENKLQYNRYKTHGNKEKKSVKSNVSGGNPSIKTTKNSNTERERKFGIIKEMMDELLKKNSEFNINWLLSLIWNSNTFYYQFVETAMKNYEKICTTYKCKTQSKTLRLFVAYKKINNINNINNDITTKKQLLDEVNDRAPSDIKKIKKYIKNNAVEFIKMINDGFFKTFFKKDLMSLFHIGLVIFAFVVYFKGDRRIMKALRVKTHKKSGIAVETPLEKQLRLSQKKKKYNFFDDISGSPLFWNGDDSSYASEIMDNLDNFEEEKGFYEDSTYGGRKIRSGPRPRYQYFTKNKKVQSYIDDYTADQNDFFSNKNGLLHGKTIMYGVMLYFIGVFFKHYKHTIDSVNENSSKNALDNCFRIYISDLVVLYCYDKVSNDLTFQDSYSKFMELNTIEHNTVENKVTNYVLNNMFITNEDKISYTCNDLNKNNQEEHPEKQEEKQEEILEIEKYFQNLPTYLCAKLTSTEDIKKKIEKEFYNKPLSEKEKSLNSIFENNDLIKREMDIYVEKKNFNVDSLGLDYYFNGYRSEEQILKTHDYVELSIIRLISSFIDKQKYEFFKEHLNNVTNVKLRKDTSDIKKLLDDMNKKLINVEDIKYISKLINNFEEQIKNFKKCLNEITKECYIKDELIKYCNELLKEINRQNPSNNLIHMDS